MLKSRNLSAPSFSVAAPTALAVVLPASCPLHTRNVTWPFFSQFRSTKPTQLLLAHNKPLAALTLDGSVDWALTHNASLYAHASFASSLFFSKSLTSYIPFLSRDPPLTISGRGSIAIAQRAPSPNPISSFSLSQNDSFLIAKNTLLAYSLDARDSSTFAHPRVSDHPTLGARYLRVNGPCTLLVSSESVSALDSALHILKRLALLLSTSSKQLRRFLAHRFNVPWLYSPSIEEAATELVRQMHKDDFKKPLPKPRPMDKKGYHVVSVTNGKASFKSVSSFDEIM